MNVVTKPIYVTVAYIPNGRSEPEERTVYSSPDEDIDMLVDRAIGEAWDMGDEPFTVLDPTGRSLWQSRRW